MKIVENANSSDPDEAAHNEAAHHSRSTLFALISLNFQCEIALMKHFFNKFVDIHVFFGT